jgi:hypothetical protein
MNRYKITFSELKAVTDALQKGHYEVFVDYINSFKGSDIHEKFKNLLKSWEHDVSYTLNFNVGDTPTKIQLSYINSQFRPLSDDVLIKEDDLEIVIGIPNQFELSDTIPIYNILKYINISGISIDLTNLSFYDRQRVIDKLPANVYNIILHNIEKLNDKTFSVDNPMLEHFRINFLSSDPLNFLKGLFMNFDDYYFKDVIFYLSKRIGGELLLQSTPLEIEYYVEKMSEDGDKSEAIHI